MNIEEAITTRKSVRSFSKKQIPLSIIKEILTLAAHSPSGSNTQPWNVHVLKGVFLKTFTSSAKKEFLKNYKKLKLERLNYMTEYREPYKSRRKKVGWDLYSLLNIKKGDYTKTRQFHSLNYEFFGAPVGLIFSIERDLGWMSWLDYGMFIQTISLAARKYGLDTCPQAAWGLVYNKVHKLLKLDKNFTVHCGMAIGYRNKNAKVNSLIAERANINDFCKFLT